MDEGSKNKIKDNIDKLLMFKAINKIQNIVEKEKQQKKSDKVHVIVIVMAFLLSLIITFFVFSIIKI